MIYMNTCKWYISDVCDTHEYICHAHVYETIQYDFTWRETLWVVCWVLLLYICTCTYTYMPIHICVKIYTCTYICICIWTHTYIYTCMSVHEMYVYKNIWVDKIWFYLERRRCEWLSYFEVLLFAYLYPYIPTHIYMHIYINIFVYTYASTYTHVYMHKRHVHPS